MTYNAKTNWKFDDPVTEDDFNRIELGIKEAHEGIEEKGNEIAEHEEKKNNPHNVNKKQIGLEYVENYGIATQSEAEAGTSNAKYMTPQRTKQAIEKLTPEGISEQDVDDKITTHAEKKDVHGLDGSTVSIGRDSEARMYGVSLGQDCKSLSMSSISIGVEAKAGIFEDGAPSIYSPIAIGEGVIASQYHSLALGCNARSIGARSVALGGLSYASGSNSLALGANAESMNADTGIIGARPGKDGPVEWIVPGSFTVNGTKNFEMPHPHPDKKETHRLRHSAVESPTAGDNLYRFEIEATEALQEVELELPDYFQYLNKNVDIWVNGVDHFGNAYGKVEGNTLKVTCEYAGKYKALVIGTRNDDHQSVQDWDLKGVERKVGESWTGETYVFEVDEILEIEEIKEEDVV